ncbi:MAG: hypothetical protein WC997_15800 [Porticoccaceae bacterium]
MKSRPIYCCDYEEPKPQIDKFAEGEGASLKDGLAASVSMRDEHDRPWHKKVHKPTRCNHEND